MIVVSYLTRPAYSRITGLTYGTLTDEDRRESTGVLEQMGCDRFGRRSGGDSCGVPVFPG
jgi:hypothetical protein